MTKKKEKLLHEAHKKYFQLILGNMPLEQIEEIIADDVSGYGTTMDEKILEIDRLRKMVVDQRVQGEGIKISYDVSPVNLRMSPDKDMAIFNDEVQIKMNNDGEENKINLRLSTVYEFLNNNWKVVHLHGSTAVETEDDTWHLNEWKRKSKELQKLVDEKTDELVAKNKELLIEAALERVRTVAMSMQKPDDILDVCKVISDQLEKLNISDIRNIQVAIIDESKKNYLNYQYFTPYSEKVFEVTEYENNPESQAMVSEMQKSANSFYAGSIKGKALQEFIAWRKKYDQYPDSVMDKSPAVFYYFYSIGNGGLGLTTYKAINDGELDIFNRFHKVFELAYSRFHDIEKAEARVREAQIEASLEKVRAISMAMQKSHELADLSLELVKQVQTLGIDTWFCAFNIYDEDDKGSLEWGSNGQGTFPKYRTPKEGVFLRYYEAGQQGESLLINEIDEKECPAHYEYLCTLPGVGEQLLKMKADGIPFPTSQIDHVAFFKYGYILFITFEPVPESHDIFKRFAKVFEQTYTRFLDLQKAEKQAREAQIETALERVRSRSMAMHNSEELKEVIQVIFDQLSLLNINAEHAGIVVDYQPKKDWHFWIAETQDIPSKVSVPYLDSIWDRQFTEAKKKGKDFFTTQLNFEEKNSFYEELLPHIQGLTKKAKNFYLKCAGLAISTVIQNDIGLYIENFSGIPYTDAENSILMRFGQVFQQSYTRFNDLKQAEVQAREAQIEVALERVRASTMAMHSSEELSNVAAVLLEQMKLLGGDLFAFGIVLCDKHENMVEQWHSMGEGEMLTPFLVPIDLDYIHRYRYDQWKAGESLFSIEIPEDYIAKHFDLMFELPTVKAGMKEMSAKGIEVEIPQWEIDYGASFSHGYLLVSSLKPFKESYIFPRFAKVFEQAYTRFLDLQKAEEQAREAQTELSLERIRSQVTVMQESSDLFDIVVNMRKEFLKLGHEADYFWYMHYLPDSYEMSMTSEDGSRIGMVITIPKYVHENIPGLVEWENSKEPTYVLALDADGAWDYIDNMNKHGQYKQVDPNAPTQEDIRRIGGLTFVLARTTHGEIGFGLPGYVSNPPQEALETLTRFAVVFDLAYRRFEDLKSAERQNRETQIQLALERTRAMVANMQNSEELLGIMVKMRAEFVSLGHEAHYFWHMKWEDDKYLKAMTSGDGTQIGMVMELPRKIHGEIPLLVAWEKSKEPTVVYVMDVPTTLDYVHKMVSWGDFKRVDPNMPTEEDIHHIGGLTYVMARTLHGEIGYSLPGMVPNPPEEAKATLIRFAGVFDLAYRRFEDLQKTEKQNRETQIELALERVRAKTMAMQKSEELADVIAHLFIQLEDLGIKTYRCNLAIVDPDKHKCRMWSTTNEGNVIPVGSDVPLTENPQFKKLYAAWKKQAGPLVFKVTGKKRLEWTSYVRNYLSFEEYKPEKIDKDRILNEPAIFSNFFFRQGFFVIHTVTDLDAAAFDVLERFAKVFEQTYTRFLDLLKAEAATREARIEASLERIRSKALGMRKSTEVGDMNDLLFDEFEKMGIEMVGCGISVINEETDQCEQWRARQLGTIDSFEAYSYKRSNQILNKNIPEIYTQFIRAWKKGDPFYTVELKGTLRDLYLNSVAELFDYDNSKQKKFLSSVPESFIVNYIFYKKGWLSLSTIKQLTEEEISFSRRFVEAFDFAHTRFLDLKQAEDQAREAVKQASLDRIRGQIASMRNTQDLQQITPLIWQELITLEIPFFRCGIFIIDDKKKKVEVYLTTPAGKPLGVLNLATDENEHTKNSVDSWRKNEVYQVHWSKKQFVEWTMEMMKLGQINSSESYQGAIEPPESLHLHFIPFAQGMLYVGNNKPLADEKIKLIRSVANAFSYAYARYEDFVVLEEAKHHVEKALNELKATQTQLIHAEKMASLGELTAGIAHEIQNPLNFVNNFSEVSADLIEEMNEEMDSGDLEEVKAITRDLKQNLEKITDHGKRASFIVRGMLEHSRTNTGEKKSTDINVLADEYLRLAYHGLRAKDKSFNADFKTDFDENLPNINVISQDLGRVLLNLINNAFYAVSARTIAKSDNEYKPTVSVRTKKLNEHIEIKVIDNGNGIPQNIKEKIFQPFFTTKPTGEGTGLGLSMSYDIVAKGHGGELNVETKINEGTEFTILLPINQK